MIPGNSADPSDDGIAMTAVARMRVRVRLVRAARGAIELAVYGAAFAVIVLLFAKTGRLGDAPARKLLWIAAMFPLLGAIAGALRRVTPLMAAQLLDRAYALDDRLANALAFAALPNAERTPMMRAAIADAAERARKESLRARRALPWSWPAEAVYACAMLVVLAGVATIEFRSRVESHRRTVVPVARDPLALAEDDVEAFREFAREMERRATTEESRRAVDRFNQFIHRIAEGQLDRQDAFRQLQSLQAELENSSQADRDALRDALRDVGQRMGESDTARQLAQALAQSDPRAAAAAMHTLAEQARNNQLTPQARQELQRALQRASQARDHEDLAQRVQRAREEVERLLRQQRERQLSQDEQRLLRQRQRDLEQLTRDQQRRENQRRQLARLERSMSQAAQNLSRDQQQQAAQDMEEGAQDLNRMNEEELSEQQMADLRQQLEDLRQRMRQQNGQGGQQQRRQIQRFAGRARGGVQPGGMPTGGVRPGRLVPGGTPGGTQPGGAQGAQRGQGAQGSQGEGQGESPGNGAGTQTDERVRGAATHIDARMRTVQVAGQHNGQGPSRSQTIRTAAQEGFTGQGYREVYPQYWDHAREVVHAGDVPPGYRSYVRRYFQLIRPRE